MSMSNGDHRSIDWQRIEKDLMAKYHGNMADTNKDEKYRNYRAALANPQEVPHGTCILQTFALFANGPDAKLRAIGRFLEKQRYMVVFSDEGGHQGAFEENTNEEVAGTVPVKDPKTGKTRRKNFVVRTDGVIRIDSRYANSPLVIAGILAHEVGHALDDEQKANGLLPDASGLNNDEIRQFRADLLSGYVLRKLGVEDRYYSPAECQAKAAEWGANWHADFLDARQNSKIKLVEKFAAFVEYMKDKGVDIENLHLLGTNSPLRKELKPYLDAFFKTPNGRTWDQLDKKRFPQFFKTLRGAVTCGRPCADEKLSPCDRKRYFPPCEDH
jgi:hypothetical protein